MGGSERIRNRFYSPIAMTTTTKTTVATTTKTTLTKAALKKITAEKQKAGKGIFAPKALSPAMADICGAKSLPRTEVTKKIWAYIKAKKLNEGRIIKPDQKLKGIFPVASIDMLKMAGYVSKHLS